MAEVTELARLAHLLRRATLGPAPGRLDELAESGHDTVLEALVARGSGADDAGAGNDLFDPPVFDVPGRLRHDDDTTFVRWWISQMAHPRQGLHERMVWFWHSHFTTSRDSVASVMLVGQHELVRRHALGNLRDLVAGMVTDAAMLVYLDGAGSVGTAPNENLARELLELFTLGRGNYTEADVRAGARALAGWWVDQDSGEAGFDPGAAYPGTVDLLGHQGRFGAEEVTEILCSHPAFAPHIAGRVYEHLVGETPGDQARAELASVLTAHDLEILPLVEAVLGHPDFTASVHARPRSPLEWFMAAGNALRIDPGRLVDHVWMLDLLGQGPFLPPNVGGWPRGTHWVTPSQQLARIGTSFWMAQYPDPDDLPFPADDPVPAAIRWCGLADVGAETREILDAAANEPLSAPDVNRLLVYLVVHSPEFALT